MYDSHTHLNEPKLFGNYKKYIENFKNIGGKKLVNVGVDFPRTERALEIEKNFPDVCLSTGGFHPTEPIFKYKNGKYEFSDEKIVSWEEYLNLTKSYLEKLILDKKIVAIGECGIDYHYFEHLNKGQTKQEVIAQQNELFLMQLDLAKEYKLPIVIHSRDAFYETCELLEDYNDLKIYFHCWGYGPEELVYVQKKYKNLWIGYDGNITYKKADDLRESIKLTDLNKILLETDAPYLTPQIIRKEINQPANVRYIYDYVSELLKIEKKELMALIENNFNNFY